MSKIKNHQRRVVIAIAGGLVVLIGLILVPYPGPGWLIVFAGLAILATEFAFAARLLGYLRIRYDKWVYWLRQQHRGVQVAALFGTGMIVLVTVWLLNTFGLINTLFSLNQDWLKSPLFR